MKLTQTNSKSLGALSRSAEGTPARVGKLAGVTAQTEVADQSDISNLSTYLAVAMSGSATHVAKVDTLGQTVSSGEYSVDAGIVGEDIIQHSILFSGAW